MKAIFLFLILLLTLNVFLKEKFSAGTLTQLMTSRLYYNSFDRWYYPYWNNHRYIRNWHNYYPYFHYPNYW
jgi:hypothetical protein